MPGDLVLLNTPASQTIYSAASPTHVINNNEPCMPMPLAASIPESFQLDKGRIVFFCGPERHSSASHFHLGSTDDDVDMISMGEVMIENPDYSAPTMWTSQPEHYPQVDQVADNIKQYQTYTMHNIQVNWASMVSIPSSVALLVKRIETVRRFQANAKRIQPHEPITGTGTI